MVVNIIFAQDRGFNDMLYLGKKIEIERDNYEVVGRGHQPDFHGYKLDYWVLRSKEGLRRIVEMTKEEYRGEKNELLG